MNLIWRFTAFAKNGDDSRGGSGGHTTSNSAVKLSKACHIAGSFRPLPGSRHFKLKRGSFVSRGRDQRGGLYSIGPLQPSKARAAVVRLYSTSQALGWPPAQTTHRMGMITRSNCTLFRTGNSFKPVCITSTSHQPALSQHKESGEPLLVCGWAAQHGVLGLTVVHVQKIMETLGPAPGAVPCGGVEGIVELGWASTMPSTPPTSNS